MAGLQTVLAEAGQGSFPAPAPVHRPVFPVVCSETHGLSSCRVPAGGGLEPERTLSAESPERRGFARCPCCRVPDRMAILPLCRRTIMSYGRTDGEGITKPTVVKRTRERCEILLVSERTKMHLHCSFMPVPPAIRQPTTNPRFFMVPGPKTGSHQHPVTGFSFFSWILWSKNVPF